MKHPFRFNILNRYVVQTLNSFSCSYMPLKKCICHFFVLCVHRRPSQDSLVSQRGFGPFDRSIIPCNYPYFLLSGLAIASTIPNSTKQQSEMFNSHLIQSIPDHPSPKVSRLNQTSILHWHMANKSEKKFNAMKFRVTSHFGCIWHLPAM